jgi:hypothetical protein
MLPAIIARSVHTLSYHRENLKANKDIIVSSKVHPLYEPGLRHTLCKQPYGRKVLFKARVSSGSGTVIQRP